MSVKRLEKGITDWLCKQIGEKSTDILDGQVTAETFKEARAYRRALKDVLAALPDIVKKESEA